MLYFWLFILSFAFFPTHAQENVNSLQTLKAQAEKDFYKIDDPNHYARVKTTLEEMKKLNPKEPYVYWARARVAFFEKESFYADNVQLPPPELEKRKLALGDICVENANKCVQLDTNNAECYLMKGSCLAMQASTWGVGFKTLNACQPMDQAWEKAMKLHSTFTHQGSASTRQLAQILRAILYRAMPEAWWFRFLAGVRGNKKQSYEWMKDAITGPLLNEPLLVIERAASTLCYAQKSKQPDLAIEGMELLKKGLKLPTRYHMDDFDKLNMQIMLDKPEEACNYRRERFEDLSESAISKKVK